MHVQCLLWRALPTHSVLEPSKFARATLCQAINSFVATSPISHPFYYSRWIIYYFIRVCCVSVNKCKCQSMWLESLYSFIYIVNYTQKLKSALGSRFTHCIATVGTKYENNHYFLLAFYLAPSFSSLLPFIPCCNNFSLPFTRVNGSVSNDDQKMKITIPDTHCVLDAK